MNNAHRVYSRQWVPWRTGASSLTARLLSCLTRVNLILGIRTASLMWLRTVSLRVDCIHGPVVSQSNSIESQNSPINGLATLSLWIGGMSSGLTKALQHGLVGLLLTISIRVRSSPPTGGVR